jgi:XTP/dITP diphosphohydrolase
MEVVIASLNTHKVYELRECLKELMPTLQVLSLFDFPKFLPIECKFSSFEENAKAKALHAAQMLQKPCICDDSGIVIPAFGKVGASLTRRYDHTASSPIAETRKLLQEMSSFKDLERQAYLECSLALAVPSGLLQSTTQRVEGIITEEERGTITFEFDTIFMKHDYSKTLGELPQSVKARISHRKKALEKIVPFLERLCFKN